MHSLVAGTLSNQQTNKQPVLAGLLIPERWVSAKAAPELGQLFLYGNVCAPIVV